MTKKNKELISIVFMYVICGFFFFGAGDFKGDAGLFPKLLSGLVAFLNTINLFIVFKNGVPEKKRKEERTNRKLLIITLLCVIYVVIIGYLGFIIASIMFLLASFYLLDVENKKRAVMVALLTVALIYICFSILLQVRVPIGIFGF